MECSTSAAAAGFFASRSRAWARRSRASIPRARTSRSPRPTPSVRGSRSTIEQATVEAVVARGESFDTVLAMEVVEHVADVPAFMSACERVLEPGGILLMSTLNRTLRSFALAIVGAEYVLGWLPRGTHDWEKFLTPEELASHARRAGLVPRKAEGLFFDPLRWEWRLSHDTAVNYVFSARKRGVSEGPTLRPGTRLQHRDRGGEKDHDDEQARAAEEPTERVGERGRFRTSEARFHSPSKARRWCAITGSRSIPTCAGA